MNFRHACLALALLPSLAAAQTSSPFSRPTAARPAPAVIESPTLTPAAAAQVAVPPAPSPTDLPPLAIVEEVPVSRIGKVNGMHIFRGTGSASTYLFEKTDKLPLEKVPVTAAQQAAQQAAQETQASEPQGSAKSPLPIGSPASEKAAAAAAIPAPAAPRAPARPNSSPSAPRPLPAR